jgi:hypothetical protein
MARIIDAGAGYATAGEERALETLKRLPSDWFVIANKILPGQRDSSYEIDAIVVGYHRIFVIDEKSWSGSISGGEEYWQLRGSRTVRSPLNKLEIVAGRLATRLRDNAVGFPGPNVRVVVPRVLMSSNSVTVHLADPRAKDGVLTLANVIDRLKEQDEAAKGDPDISKFHPEIERVL